MIVRFRQPSMWTICERCLAATFLCVALGATGATNAFAQTSHESLHGAHEVFVSPDAAVVWAVLKSPASDKAAVWLRVVNTGKKFSHVSVDGVDPFSKKRERVQPGVPLSTDVRIESDRESFSDLPSREVHFYRSEADLRAEKPALTVYYLGVPDQTPEFSTRAALDAYFNLVKLVSHVSSLKTP
jgi:hypothetical protein